MKKVQKSLAASGATLFAWLLAGAVSAQTTATSTTPGVPNTGAGGDVTANLLILAVSGIVALVGIAYLTRRARQS